MLKLNGRGVVITSSPFDAIVKPNLVITVLAMRTLRDLEAAELNPEELIYKANGIGDNYETDLANNVTIYTVQDDAGNTIYLPQTYVRSRLDTGGNEFVEKTIGVSIGLIPQGYLMDELEAKVIELIQDTINITPKVVSINSSATITISDEDANIINARLRTPDMTSCRVKYRQLLKALDSLKCKYKALECKITNS